MRTILTSLFLFFSFSLGAIETLTIEGQRLRSTKQGYDLFIDEQDTSLSELMLRLPSFTRVGGSNRPRFYQVRGLGDRGQFTHAQVNAVGVFYNHIDLSEEASVQPIFRGDTLNAVYGPDAIEWGSKAQAASLHSKTCWSDCLESEIQLGFEEYQGAHYRHRESLRLGESDFKLGLGLYRSETAYKNTYYRRSTNQQEELDLVFAGRHYLGDRQLTHHHLFALHDNGYDVWSTQTPFQTRSDEPGRDFHRVHGHSLEYLAKNWSWISSLTHTSQIESYDEDWGNQADWFRLPGWNQSYQYYSEFYRTRLKHHHKLNYAVSSDLTLRLHFHDFKEKIERRSTKEQRLRSQDNTTFHDSQLALAATQAFERGAWNSELSLRLGLQRARIELTQDRLKESYVVSSLRFEQAYQISPQLKWSALTQYATRGGGFNTDASLAPALRPYRPETLAHLETGLEIHDINYQLKLNGFYYRYFDQQVRSSSQTDPTDPSTFFSYTSNLGRLEIGGLEVFLATFWRSWTFELSSTLMHSTQNQPARELAYAPAFNAHTAVSFDFSKMNFRAALKYTGSHYYSTDHQFKSAPTQQLDLSWSLKLYRKLKLVLYVQNATDELIPLRAYYFANEPPDWNDRLYLQYARPRTVGLNFVW